jgi:hypothetical protein
MVWLFRTGGLRAAGAAMLVFAALLVVAPAPSSASSYTLTFTGKVTQTGAGMSGNVFDAFGVVAGDPISGTLTIDTLSNTVTFGKPGKNTFDQTGTAFAFGINHSGSPGAGLTFTDSGTGLVQSEGTDTYSLLGIVAQGTSSLGVAFVSNSPGTPLVTLAGLPNTPDGLIAMLGGVAPVTSGQFTLGTFGSVIFQVDLSATAVTPIPAALPLFASAIGGLGFLGWRRKARANG